MNRILLAALALACLAVSLLPPAALADTPAPPPAIVLPWGDWLVAVAHALTEVLIPVLIAVLTAAIGRVAPWAVLLLSQQRIEATVRASVDYGLNAADGAAKGRTLTIPVATAVIAKAVQRADDVAPKRVVKKAGGLPGIAERVFCSLDLEPGATAANVLAPAVAALRTGRG